MSPDKPDITQKNHFESKPENLICLDTTSDFMAAPGIKPVIEDDTISTLLEKWSKTRRLFTLQEG